MDNKENKMFVQIKGDNGKASYIAWYAHVQFGSPATNQTTNGFVSGKLEGKCQINKLVGSKPIDLEQKNLEISISKFNKISLTRRILRFFCLIGATSVYKTTKINLVDPGCEIKMKEMYVCENIHFRFGHLEVCKKIR